MSVNKVNSDGSLTRIAGGTLYADAPLGTILAFGGTTAPTGWMLCQGQAISRTTYAKLFAIIGTAFGSGDGSTTFNLPDLREATTKGAGLTGKSSNHMDSDGLAVGEFIDDRVQEHYHSCVNNQNFFITGSGGTMQIGGSGNYGGSNKTTTNASGRYGATTEVKAVGVNYIIKVMMVSLPADFAEQAQPKNLVNPININEETKTTVESALSGFSSLLNIVNLAENYDLNNCTTSVCIKAWGTPATNIVNSLVNKPTLTYGAGECTVLYIPMSSQWGTQIFIGGNGDNVEVWRRRRKTNGWSAWVKWL